MRWPDPDQLAADRGQAMAIEILRMFVALIMGALLFMLLQEAWVDVDGRVTNTTTNQTALQGWQWSTTIWNNLPLGILVISGLAVLVVAVFLQRRA